LEKTDLDEKWGKFVKSSLNGTIFSYPDYLKSINANVSVYYCLKKKEIRAALSVVESEDKEATILHDFVIYNGIMFALPVKTQNHYQVLSEHYKITTFISEELAKIYKNIALSLHPSIIDIRPFLWHNYGTDIPKYVPDVRYTTYVDITEFSDAERNEDISIFSNTSSSRRQEIRYAIRDKVRTKDTFNAELFVNFYNKTMSRQGIVAKDHILNEMEHLVTNMFKSGLGRMFVSYTAEGEPGSMVFFGIDNKRSYYIFGANDPSMRDSHTGSVVLWDAFYALSKDGVKEVDLEGINSPYRGWFKLSFGGDIRPYFHLYKNAVTSY
jgi:hypothetical protein